MINNSIYNRHVVISAFRYALGRRSIIVGEICEWLIAIKSNISDNDKLIISTEIEDALENNRAGDDCDIQEWKHVFITLRKDLLESGYIK